MESGEGRLGAFPGAPLGSELDHLFTKEEIDLQWRLGFWGVPRKILWGLGKDFHMGGASLMESA